MSWLRGELVVITTNYSPCRTAQVFGHISNHYLLLRRYGMCVYWERLFMLLACPSNRPPPRYMSETLCWRDLQRYFGSNDGSYFGVSEVCRIPQ